MRFWPDLTSELILKKNWNEYNIFLLRRCLPPSNHQNHPKMKIPLFLHKWVQICLKLIKIVNLALKVGFMGQKNDDKVPKSHVGRRDFRTILAYIRPFFGHLCTPRMTFGAPVVHFWWIMTISAKRIGKKSQKRPILADSQNIPKKCSNAFISECVVAKNFRYSTVYNF